MSRLVELEEPIGRSIVASVIIGNEKRGRKQPADMLACVTRWS